MSPDGLRDARRTPTVIEREKEANFLGEDVSPHETWRDPEMLVCQESLGLTSIGSPEPSLFRSLLPYSPSLVLPRNLLSGGAHNFP